jgi:hypothetical protein
MNFLTRKIPWATWQFGVLKIAMLSLGILFGVYFTEFWRPLLALIWIVGVVTTIWVSVIWLRAMRQSVQMAGGPPLDQFGQFLMANLRDKAIEFFDRLAEGQWKAGRLQQLQADLTGLDESQRSILRRCVVDVTDNAIHDFLFALQELADFEDDIQVVVQGQNIAKISDGLHGELFTTDGWMAKYSAFGKLPERA